MKKLTLILIVFILILNITQTFSQTLSELEKAQNSLQTKGEVYFKFNITTKEEIKFLTKIISIDNVKDNVVYAYASPSQFEKFLPFDYDFVVLSKLMPGKALTMATTVAQMVNWDRYPTYDVYLQMMQLFAQNYPALCRLDTIGTSQNGRLVLAVKITDNPDIDEDEPEFFYSGTMHGDEVAGFVLLLRLLDYLLSNYGTNAQVTNLVDNIEIWINPLANPDGTYFGGNNTVALAIRYLANGIDANRNFPDPEDGDHPDGNAWAIETIDMMNFADEHDFVMAANIHGGAEVANYPWDTWPCGTHPHADDNWWEYVCKQYADTVFDNSPSGYFTSVSSNGYICGYDWYEINGGRQDYMTYFKHCREFTLEISDNKLLDAELLPAHWGYNYKSFLNYIRQSLYGIRGIITDSCTGQPIIAKVEIIGHDYDNSFVYSSLPIGNYHRPIYAGTFNVTFSAPGYQTKTINNISVSNENTVVVNVQLTPIAPIANFTASDVSSCIGDISFINQSSAYSDVIWFWDFGDGNTSTEENPIHIYTNNGTYNVMLIAVSCIGNDTIIKNNYITINLPDAPTVVADTACENESVTLSASGTGTIYWYDAEINGNLLDTGTIYVTPSLTSTTTYYVENHVQQPPQYVGETNDTTNGNYFTSSTQHYLVFNCYSIVKLVSVAVNAQTSGNRIIQLQDSSGNTLQSVTINIPSGFSRIELNFDLPVANNLRLVGPPSPNLFRSNAGLSYPYEIPGLISITHSSSTFNPTGYYYYFYDWEIREQDCISAIVPVTATIIPLPTADFTYSTDNFTVYFTNQSLNADSYFWDFGDGTTDTILNPSHTYNDSGLYNAMLIAYDSCGTDTIIYSIPVGIVGITENVFDFKDITIYPNPTEGEFNIEVKSQILNLEVFNIYGEKVFKSQILPMAIGTKSKIQIDLSDYAKGLYFVRIITEGQVFTEKLIFR